MFVCVLRYWFWSNYKLICRMILFASCFSFGSCSLWGQKTDVRNLIRSEKQLFLEKGHSVRTTDWCFSSALLWPSHNRTCRKLHQARGSSLSPPDTPRLNAWFITPVFKTWVRIVNSGCPQQVPKLLWWSGISELLKFCVSLPYGYIFCSWLWCLKLILEFMVNMISRINEITWEILLVSYYMWD